MQKNSSFATHSELPKRNRQHPWYCDNQPHHNHQEAWLVPMNAEGLGARSALV